MAKGFKTPDELISNPKQKIQVQTLKDMETQPISVVSNIRRDPIAQVIQDRKMPLYRLGFLVIAVLI